MPSSMAGMREGSLRGLNACLCLFYPCFGGLGNRFHLLLPAIPGGLAGAAEVDPAGLPYKKAEFARAPRQAIAAGGPRLFRASAL